MKRKTREQFINDANKVHNNEYDYSKVNYVNNKTKVCIICVKHGEFLQRPDRHLLGQGCPVCRYIKSANSNIKLSKDKFITEANSVHGNKYDYSNVEYKGTHTRVSIICPEHGEFWQTPVHHLRGQGCPICSESHLEREIRLFLLNKNEEFIQEYKTEWLGKQSLDFYLPQYNAAIECQGKQHFGLGGWCNEDSSIIEERDKRKVILCKENGIKLFYYSNLGIDYPYEVFEDKNEILKLMKT